MSEPSWRKPVGIFVIVALITLCAGLVLSVAESVGEWPILVQALFYLVCGLIWIAPLKPLLKWMETGKF
jgi:hypothetical protein